MVKKTDLDDLFNSIQNIDTEEESQTLTGLSEALGKAKIKQHVLQLMQDWYASINRRGKK